MRSTSFPPYPAVALPQRIMHYMAMDCLTAASSVSFSTKILSMICLCAPCGRFIGSSWLAGVTEGAIWLPNTMIHQFFHGATYADLIKKNRRPFVILNASDMSIGEPFAFIQ